VRIILTNGRGAFALREQVQERIAKEMGAFYMAEEKGESGLKAVRRVRFVFRREGTIIEHDLVRDGETYAGALLAHGIVPDTVLIFHRGRWLPEDAPVEEDEVEIITTASRG
jgi:hypothetical protein